MTKTETNLDLAELLEYLDPGEMDYTEVMANAAFYLAEPTQKLPALMAASE